MDLNFLIFLGSARDSSPSKLARDPVAAVAKRHGINAQTIYTWRKHYNEDHPHSSLGYLTPAEFVAKTTTSASVQATGQDAAVLGAFAPRPVAQRQQPGAVLST